MVTLPGHSSQGQTYSVLAYPWNGISIPSSRLHYLSQKHCWWMLYLNLGMDGRCRLHVSSVDSASDPVVCRSTSVSPVKTCCLYQVTYGTEKLNICTHCWVTEHGMDPLGPTSAQTASFLFSLFKTHGLAPQTIKTVGPSLASVLRNTGKANPGLGWKT